MKLLTKFTIFLILAAGIFYGCEKEDDDPQDTITDADGNVYKTVQIGSQTWMAENLKTTVFNDKTPIAKVTGSSEWEALLTPGYCWYNNDDTRKDTLGAIYNWHAVHTGKLCPTGWHVPNDSDFIALELTLGLPQSDIHVYGWHGTDQGAQLKSKTTWMGGQENATNSSKFSALAAGYRQKRIGIYSGLGTITLFWTSSDDSHNNKPYEAWYRRLDATEKKIYKGTALKAAGNYVRCVKN